MRALNHLPFTILCTRTRVAHTGAVAAHSAADGMTNVGRPAIIEPIPTPLPDEELIARIFRGLGDASRIKILKTLLNGPKTQREIVTAVELSQGRVSQHLSCLVWCGYLSSERHGRSVVYEIANPRVTALLDIGSGFLDSTTGDISSCRIIAPDRGRNAE